MRMPDEGFQRIWSASKIFRPHRQFAKKASLSMQDLRTSAYDVMQAKLYFIPLHSNFFLV